LMVVLVGMASLAALLITSCTSTSAGSTAPRTLQVDQNIQSEGISITVKQVRLYASETLVLYQITLPDGVYPEGPLRSPTIEYGDQALRSGTHPDIDGLKVLSFSALPKETTEFTLNINPYLQLNGPAANFSIPLGDQVGTTPPPPEGRELQMDQLIQVGTVKFKLTSFVMRPDSFEFTYQPEPGSETSGMILAGPGPIFETMSVTDDNGNSYRPGTGTGTRLNFVTGHPQLKTQTIGFESALQTGTTRLDVRIMATGIIGPEPFRFKIQINPG